MGTKYSEKLGLNYLDKDYKYVLQITCPFELKENVKDLLKSAEFVTQKDKLKTKENKHIL